ncbi:MAG: kelch repeat-containing protein [Gemmataceae bacterium]
MRRRLGAVRLWSTFLVLGGRTDWANYKKPRPYDVLAFDPAGKWLDELPAKSDWRLGWKGESWSLTDATGNTRPNWTVYGTFSLGQKYAYDPDTKAFYFYAGGSTFKYDPALKQWKDLNPPTHPEKELGGILLWSSMCYDTDAKKFVLFGGGNIQTERGDPGTWTYSPNENKWEQLKLATQPPARANSRLVYDPVNKKTVLFGGDMLHELHADVWTLDLSKGWEQRQPKRGPQPRAGHAMLWLPKAKKVLLLGGYTHTSTVEYVASLYKALPMEAWTYDAATDEWQCNGHWEKDAPTGPSNFFLSATVNGNDEVLLLDSQNRAWTIRIDADKPDPQLAAKYGSSPHLGLKRSGSHDPAWYDDVPKPDADKVAAELKDLPTNKWTIRPTPKRPLMNMDWGSAVFDPA